MVTSNGGDDYEVTPQRQDFPVWLANAQDRKEPVPSDYEHQPMQMQRHTGSRMKSRT